jgi:DNA-binding NarL/FixJ family response regulator
MGSSTYYTGGMIPSSRHTTRRILSALVLEDQTILREMLVELLETDGRFASISSCGSAVEAKAKAAAEAIDLAVLDLMLPDGHGLDVLAEIRRTRPRCRSIVLTSQDRPEVVHAAVKTGARGVVMKGAPLKELREAVDRVLGGGVHYCPASAALLHDSLGGQSREEPLSSRERQVLQRVASGASTKEIASHLGIREKTVSNHRAAIMRKLDIHDIAGLTRYALRQGLVEL